MSTVAKAAERRAYGSVGGHPVSFLAAYRNDTPADVNVTISVGMSYEDITAALFAALDGMELSELDDPDYVRRLVLDTLLNSSLDKIEDARTTIAETRPFTHTSALISAIRRRVAEVFSPVAAALPAPRRALAEVSAR